jgi:hypothetical protein
MYKDEYDRADLPRMRSGYRWTLLLPLRQPRVGTDCLYSLRA